MGVAAKAVVQMGMETAQYAQSLNKTRSQTSSFFKDLQSQYGRQSTLAKSLKLLSGGGAVLGLGLAAREFSALGAKIKEIATDTKSSAGEMVEKFTEGLPIIGGVYSGLKDIIGAISGIDREIAQINAEAANQDKITDSFKHLIQSNTETSASIDETWRKTFQHMEGLLTGGFGQKMIEHLHQMQDEVKSASDEIDKGKSGNKNLVDDKKSLADLKSQLAGVYVPSFQQEYVNAGVGSSGYTSNNQAEIDAAIKQQSSLSAQIDQIKKKIKAQEANIEEAGNEKILAATAQYYGNLIDLNVKYGSDWLGKFAEQSQSQMKAIKKNNAEQHKQELERQKQEQKSMQDRAKSLLDSIETPLEKYRNKVTELQGLLAKGALSSADFDKLKNNLDKELQKETADKAPGPVQVAEVRHAFTVPAGQGDVAKQHLEVSRRALTELVKGNQTQAQIKQALASGGIGLITSIF